MTTTSTTTEAIKQEPIITIDEALARINILESSPEKDELLAQLTKDLKEENKKAVSIAITKFVELAEKSDDYSEFVSEFINHPYADTQRLKQDDDSGKWEIASGKRRLIFEQVDKLYSERNDGKSIARSKRYEGMIARFTHNLYLNKAGELSEDAEKKVITVCFVGDVEEKIENYEFSGCSIGKLYEQLAAIVKTIFPEDQAPRMVKADVRYVITGFSRAHDGKTKTMDEKSVSKLIWDAIAVRNHNVAYEIDSKAKCHREKHGKTANDRNSEKLEADISKIPERAEAAATLSKKET